MIDSEQSYLDSLKPEYNACGIAGSTIGRTHSAETRQKIREKAVGRKWSEDAKRRLSEKTKGRKLPPERCTHLIGNDHAKGLKHTEEWKEAARAWMTGQKRPKSPEVREKIASALRGRKATPEARARQAAAQLGKKRGPYRKRSTASGTEPA